MYVWQLLFYWIIWGENLVVKFLAFLVCFVYCALTSQPADGSSVTCKNYFNFYSQVNQVKGFGELLLLNRKISASFV